MPTLQNSHSFLLFSQQAQASLSLPPCHRRLFRSHVLLTSLSPRHTHSSVFPIYNHDLRHFTPAFLLSSEKVKSETLSPVRPLTWLLRRRSFKERCASSASNWSVTLSKSRACVFRPRRVSIARSVRSVSRITGITWQRKDIKGESLKTSLTKI